MEEKESIFKKEVFTDNFGRTIEVFTPVEISSSGKISINNEGQKKFIGSTRLQASTGEVFPHAFQMSVKNIRQAIDSFDSVCHSSIEEERKRIQAEIKEQEKTIVTPNAPGKIII